jgi:DNA polymerase I-like protein with 3'-5' exonuclease and polymerase domains
MNILFYISNADKPFLARLQKHLRGHDVWLANSFSMLAELVIKAKEKKADWIVTTRKDILDALCKAEGYDSREDINLYDYVGSIFHYKGIKILIQAPLQQLVVSSTGEFIFGRMIKKITQPAMWIEPTEFNFIVATAENLPKLYEQFQNAWAIAIDIETNPDEMVMKECGYTGLFWDQATKKFTSITFTIELTEQTGMFMLAWIRKFNQLPAPKILQNGKYDLAYFLRYDALFDNYLWDTINIFHSYYTELPKDLGFQSAFFIRDFKYWKHEVGSADSYTRLQYNGKDTWVTANALLAAFAEMPDWAVENYLMEFPLVAPDFYLECVGIAADVEQLKAVKARKEEELDSELASLKRMISSGFNPNSPKQVLLLLHTLGHTNAKSSDEDSLKAIAYIDPLAAFYIEKILICREKSKAISTYLKEDKLFHGGIDGKTPKEGRRPRILYAVNPHGTETARNSSKGHHLGSKKRKVGLQIQNITRSESKDPLDNIKSYFISDEGFVFGEADYAQAESRDTGYLSGDTALIEAVTGPRDFHGVNGSAFFGIPYEEIIETTIDENGKSHHKVLNEPIRQLAKPVNHGANYNMGEGVLISTMGLKQIYNAAKLLKLPPGMMAKQIAAYLLAAFERTYKIIKKDWYQKVITDVMVNHKLVSPKINGHSWTRWCFKDPSKSKPALNAYVAHPPQNLNALTLNAAFKRVFYDIQLNPVYMDNFRLSAQIHDSILYQYRIGHDYLNDEVKKLMEFPVDVTDTFGITRTLVVPVDVKGGKQRWG